MNGARGPTASHADEGAVDELDPIERLIDAEGWVFDLDGCLVHTATPGGAGGTLIDGAVELLQWLRSHGRAFIVCTNASQRPAREYAAQLRALGLALDDGQIVTAATAAADRVAAAHPGAAVIALGDFGLEDALGERGLELVTPAQAAAGSVAAAVVVGTADSYTAAAINAAGLAIANHGAAFYTTVEDPWFHGGKGRSVAASAAIAGALTAVTGQRPTVCGKPSPALAEVLRARLGGAGRRLVVVGDTVTMDMALARRMGALGVLVLSGATSEADLARLPRDERPPLWVRDVGDLVRRIRQADPPGDPR